MHLFPFAGAGNVPSSERALLVTNHEYTHEEILHPDGLVGAGYTIAKTRKSQAAHGLCVLEARRVQGKWTVNRNSPYGRRITGNTRMRISGPAAGHALMKVNEYTLTDNGSFPTGKTSDGTVCQWHAEQLRPRRHALGHLPVGRGKLERLLRQHHRQRQHRSGHARSAN